MTDFVLRGGTVVFPDRAPERARSPGDDGDAILQGVHAIPLSCKLVMNGAPMGLRRISARPVSP